MWKRSREKNWSRAWLGVGLGVGVGVGVGVRKRLAVLEHLVRAHDQVEVVLGQELTHHVRAWSGLG